MRKYGFVLFLLLPVLIVTISGCGGGGGGGQTAAANGSVVTNQGVIGPGPQCTYGGVAIEVGIDENGNGVLDSPGEVDSTEYVCNGADGSAGVNALVNITSEAPGSNCGNGGFRVDVGADTNSNTILDAGEITATDYICNGTAVVITGIDPSSARIGDEVTISGAGFGSVQGTLTVGGANAPSITSWNNNVIVAAVPSGATTGLVTVSVDGVASNPVDLVVLWTLSNPDNVAIASTTDYQSGPRITSDGSGGAIVVWYDYRNGGSDIYAQRVDSTGAVLWVTNGIGVSVTSGTQWNPAITSDGSGGAIIAWTDNRSGNYDIYAQKFSSRGAAQWTANGVAIIKAANIQDKVEIIPDGSGGAIMVWEDYRDSATNGYDIYAQRVDRLGSPSWTKNGVSVTNAVNHQRSPRIISDGAGGAIITWEDLRNSATTGYDIYAQKILSTGISAWPVNGIIISNANGAQLVPELASDGAGGAYIAWQDFRGGNISDVNFNHVDTDGTRTFADLGHYVKGAGTSLNQREPAITSDGSGGAIIAWMDYVNTPTRNVYAQKVNASYAYPLRWATNGVEILSDTSLAYLSPEIAGDGNGGAIIVWSGYDIIGQKVDHRGVLQWGPNGVGITTAWNNTSNKQIISDGSGGAIVVWEDYRLDFGSNMNIYAQGVSADGE